MDHDGSFEQLLDAMDQLSIAVKQRAGSQSGSRTTSRGRCVHLGTTSVSITCSFEPCRTWFFPMFCPGDLFVLLRSARRIARLRKPLALYIFAPAPVVDHVIASTSSGAVLVGDTSVHKGKLVLDKSGI